MYIEEPFDRTYVLRATEEVIAARDEFLQFLATHKPLSDLEGTDRADSLFSVFDSWLGEKNAEVPGVLFVGDQTASWKRFLEFVPAIYLSAVDAASQSPELREKFTSVLPIPFIDDDGTALARVGFLLQGASMSWPVSDVLRSAFSGGESE